MFEKIVSLLCAIFHSVSFIDNINFDSIFLRSDDPMEDDKEKKELDCLTIENGIAPNHGLAFLFIFHCVFWFYFG